MHTAGRRRRYYVIITMSQDIYTLVPYVYHRCHCTQVCFHPLIDWWIQSTCSAGFSPLYMAFLLSLLWISISTHGPNTNSTHLSIDRLSWINTHISWIVPVDRPARRRPATTHPTMTDWHQVYMQPLTPVPPPSMPMPQPSSLPLNLTPRPSSSRPSLPYLHLLLPACTPNTKKN